MKRRLNPMTERGGTCEFCGREAKPHPRAGKRRYPHKCSHGEWCVRGHRLLGIHANHPLCRECVAVFVATRETETFSPATWRRSTS